MLLRDSLRRPCFTIFAIGSIFSLGACSTGMDAVVQSVRQVVQLGGETNAAPLDPKFAYLRITRGSHVGLLWRGSTEPSPAGLIEVYYSGSGEVVRLQNGRIVGALGLTTEWRRVAVTAPAWRAVAASGEPAAAVRSRDVMPGYRSGVRDELILGVIPVPAGTALHGVDPKTLTWFEETLQHGAARGFRLSGAAPDALPPARYAVDLAGAQETVVYSEQCLAFDLCFAWQRWSAAMQKATAAGPLTAGTAQP